MLNKVIMIARVAKVEKIFMKNGDCALSLTVHNKVGSIYFPVLYINKDAHDLEIEKNDTVYFEGYLHQKRWIDADDNKRTYTKIIAKYLKKMEGIEL